MKKKWLFVSGVLLLTGLCGRGPMVSLMKRAAAQDGGAVVVAGETGSEDRGEEVATKVEGAAGDFGVRVKAERGEVDFGALHAFREWEDRYMAAGDEDRAGTGGGGESGAADGGGGEDCGGDAGGRDVSGFGDGDADDD